jgi:bis(5'-adenosyl)-triphosphatase
MNNTTDQSTESCLFCSEQILEKSFFSIANFSAFYNIAPILPGHSLIVPNRHCESLFELSDDELCEMMCFARNITKVLKSVFECDGFDWTLQDGVSAGQTVPHLHLHIIPRKPMDINDGNGWYSKTIQNEKQMLDSQHRERLNDAQYTEISKLLAEASATILK